MSEENILVNKDAHGIQPTDVKVDEVGHGVRISNEGPSKPDTANTSQLATSSSRAQPFSPYQRLLNSLNMKSPSKKSHKSMERSRR